jgi:hypothetical protein
MKHKLRYIWRTLIGVAYLAIVIGVVSIATTKFETIVLAVLVQVYSAVLYNFSALGAASDANNYAGLVRFRILAAAQGVTENEDGTFLQQEKFLVDSIASSRTTIIINNLSNAAVSTYALFKIVQAIVF